MDRHPTRLTVHIGPPKTATTVVQQVLDEAQEALSAQGIGYGLSNRPRADFVLVGKLGHLTTYPDRENWHLGREATADSDVTDFLTGHPHRLISTEDFFDADPSVATVLLEVMQPRALEIVAGIRRPDQWLWSMWQQACKDPLWPEWDDFIEKHLADHLLLPSNFLAPWIGHSVPEGTSIHLLRLEDFGATHPAIHFARLLGIDLDLALPIANAPAWSNASMRPRETLLTAWFVRECARMLREECWSYYGDIPMGFVRRSTVDLVDLARPLFERASNRPSEESFFDSPWRERCPALEEFVSLWSRDAWAVAHSDWPLTADARAALESSARAAQAALERGLVRGPQGAGFPVRDFASLVTIDADLLALARSVSFAVGQAWMIAQSTR